MKASMVLFNIDGGIEYMVILILYIIVGYVFSLFFVKSLEILKRMYKLAIVLKEGVRILRMFEESENGKFYITIENNQILKSFDKKFNSLGKKDKKAVITYLLEVKKDSESRYFRDKHRDNWIDSLK